MNIARIDTIPRLDIFLYRWQWVRAGATPRSGGTWGGPEPIDADHRVSGAPAAFLYQGALHVVAAGHDRVIQHWWKDTTWHWERTPAMYSGNPDVIAFHNQLQIFGRGMDGKLISVWYDPLDGQWNVEDHEVAVGD